MKKLFTLLAVAMLAIVNANAQTNGLEPVDIFIWGSGNSHLTPEDTIPIGDLVDGEYNGYLPVVIECPDVAEVVDIGTKETIGFSKHIKINDVAQLRAFEMNSNKTVQYGTIIVRKAYTRPAQMRPFTDTIYVEEGKQYTLRPWHWVPCEEPFIGTGRWWINGETLIQDGMIQDGMMSVKIFGPTQGDTVVYTVRVVDRRNAVMIVNTFIVIGTQKSESGVEDNEILNFSIYPNPSNDGFVTIKGDGTAKIFNILGQKVMDVEVMNETKVSLCSGLYIVRMGGHSEKVFVE